MRALLGVVVLFGVVTGVLGASRFHERNHTGLLALYGFDDGQRSVDLKPTTARDYTGLGLLGDLIVSTTAVEWSANRAGFSVGTVGGNRMVSEKTSRDLVGRLGNEFSIEIWITSGVNLGDVFIMGFGNWTAGSSVQYCDADSVDEGGWRTFASLGYGVRSQLVSLYDGTPGCIEFSYASDDLLPRLSVIRGRPSFLGVYSEGAFERTIDPHDRIGAPYWLQHPAHLTIATPSANRAWKGSIYMIAFYNRFIEDAEMNRNKIFGLPNSLPTATRSAIAATEDVTIALS